MLSADQLKMMDRARETRRDRNTFVLSDEEYSVRRFLPNREFLSVLGARVRFAEDDCGNGFEFDRNTMVVYFWDHETDESTKLASSLEEFLSGLVAATPVELAPGRVISAWIDPALLDESEDEEP